MTISRILSIVAAVFFAVLFVVLSGFVIKSLALGFCAIAVVWAITGWTTTVYARGGSREGGGIGVDEAGFRFDIGSLWALLAAGLCIGGGFLVVYLLTLIPEVSRWIA